MSFMLRDTKMDRVDVESLLQVGPLVTGRALWGGISLRVVPRLRGGGTSSSLRLVGPQPRIVRSRSQGNLLFKASAMMGGLGMIGGSPQRNDDQTLVEVNQQQEDDLDA